MDKIRILVVAPGEAPKIEEIDNSLEAMQAVVGGYIEYVEIEDGVSIVCDEEGKLKRASVPNRPYNGDILVGTFFISRGNEDGEAVSLTDEDVAKYTAMFQEIPKW